MANFFDEHFEGCAEMHQPDMTFRRVARDVGGAITTSRIDRIYSTLTAFSLAQYAVQVGVRGDLFDRRAASDHRAVVLTVRRKARTRPPQVSSHVSRHGAFKEEMRAELHGQSVPTHFASAYSVLRRSGLEVQRRVRRRVVRYGEAPLGCSRKLACRRFA